MIPTIAQVVESVGLPPEQEAVLVQHLTQREDQIADVLRQAGQQFGAMPEIVAEVLATIGLGTPPDDVTRAFIHQQFVDLMERLRREFGQQ